MKQEKMKMAKVLDKNEEIDSATLLEICEETLKSFNPLNCTVDAHAIQVLGDNVDANHNKQFVKQVLYGCVRYKNALKVLITSFYYNNSATTSRGDYTKYLVLSYLAIFRLEELGFAGFRQIVRSQSPEKMHVLLSYLFDQETIEKWVKDEWIKYYDLRFVEDVMIGSLMRFKPEVEGLCEELSVDAFGMAQKREEQSKQAGIPQVISKPPTIAKPFNITPARPVHVPEPMKIVQNIKANPVPTNLNERTLEMIENERKAAKAETYEKTMKKYSSDQEFQLHETRDTLTKVVEEHEKQLEKVLNKRFVANPVPDFESKPAVVKMNASAILREDALYKKKQEQEAKLIEAYEQDLRDSTDFYKWQAEKRQQDEAEKVRMVVKRRMESAASQEEARLASLRRVDDNRKVAVHMRLKRHEILEENQKRVERAVEENRVRVDAVKARKDNPQKEKAKIKRKNRETMAEMRALQRKMEEEKQRADELEQERRNDLIRRIRALERVPTKRVSQFDPSESGGHGLLEEMSLLELKERLAMNQVKEKKEKVDLQKKIIQHKLEKEKAMQERLDTIRKARVAAAKANRTSRKIRKEQDEENARIEQEIKDEAKLKLADKLAKIRDEREAEIRKLQEEEEKLHKRNLFLGAAKDMVEEKVHQELIKGKEREIRVQQKRTQDEARKYEQIKAGEEKIRDNNRRREIQAQRIKDRQRADVLQETAKRTKEKSYAVLKEKRQAVRKEQQRYHISRSKLDKINPYGTSLKTGVPLQVIQSMNRDQLGKFYQGKNRDVEKLCEYMFQGTKTINDSHPSSSTNFSTHAEALDAIAEMR